MQNVLLVTQRQTCSIVKSALAKAVNVDYNFCYNSVLILSAHLLNSII